MKRFQGGLIFKAHGLVYHSTLGWRVIQKEEKGSVSALSRAPAALSIFRTTSETGTSNPNLEGTFVAFLAGTAACRRECSGHWVRLTSNIAIPTPNPQPPACRNCGQDCEFWVPLSARCPMRHTQGYLALKEPRMQELGRADASARTEHWVHPNS